MSDRVLVACVGNIFLGDDAFGVEMAQRLSQRKLPNGVCVVDFGIRSYDLAYAVMDRWELVIIVDALPRGDKPGTICAIEPDLPANAEAAERPRFDEHGFDAHTMNPMGVLQLVSAMGGTWGRIVVVGCEPASVLPSAEGRIGLSEPVRAALDEAVVMVEQLIASALSATAESI